MLMNCPECSSQVSDQASCCPHCGYPIPGTKKNKRVSASRSKKMRLPNGFGQISHINGKNLRNPYRASITVGKTETGRHIVKPLQPKAYFATYNEAYTALCEYNKNPYDLNSEITMQELFDRWSPIHFATLKTEASRNHFRISWKYCSAIYDVKVNVFRIRHIKECMDNGFIIVGNKKRYATDGQKNRIKTLFNLMLDYAVEYDLVDKNYARQYKLPKELTEAKTTAENPHIAFTDDEIKILWKNTDIDFVRYMLIQIYSGWRPQEFCNLKLEDIDLENWTFKGGSKTDAGMNRVVPIHPKIRTFVKEQYNESKTIGSLTLVFDINAKNQKIKPLVYKKFYNRFSEMVNTLGLNPEHRPHDTRKTFVTLAKDSEVNEYAIKYLIGHAITDLTERVYTERDIGWLTTELLKID